MKKNPNVIVFLTDQQRWDSVGLHGNPLDLTPNFDRVARRNTHLGHCFTCQPVCGPARSCLQTGLYATQTGVWHNSIALPEDSITLPKCFNEAGYRTGYIGKWHLGAAEEVGAVAAKHRGGYQDWLAANALEFTSDAYQTRVWDEQNRPHDLPGYRVDALTDAAVRYVDAHKRDPFFLFLSHIEPHQQNHVDDFPPPTGYRERYTGRWMPADLAALGGSSAQHLGGYWGMVKRLDEAFGRLMDALKSLHIDRETIVLFASDHGCHFKTRNNEYKRSCHESSIRIPSLLAGPGFEGGGELPQLVSLVDLPPTLLDAAGLPVPQGMMGQSLMPLVRGEDMAWQDEVFVQISEAETGRAVRTKRWKYSVTAPDNRGPISERYREAYLYDLQHDPHELCNLIEQKSHERVREVMRRRLLGRIKTVEGVTPEIEQAASKPSGQRRVSEQEAME